jgi:hypothetical protein
MIESAKSLIKSAFPGGVRVYHRLKGLPEKDSRPPDLREAFTRIYLTNAWGDAESVSGRGSTLARTEVIRTALPSLLTDAAAKSIFDAACGDFNWMRQVDLNELEYTGADIVPKMVARNHRLYGHRGRSFVVMDVTSDPIPQVDLILCRDCFIHLSFKDIKAALDNFKRSNSTFLVGTTHVSVTENEDTQSGGWRSVNLQMPPFNLPPPASLLIEDPELGKCLGLWRLAEL